MRQKFPWSLNLPTSVIPLWNHWDKGREANLCHRSLFWILIKWTALVLLKSPRKQFWQTRSNLMILCRQLRLRAIKSRSILSQTLTLLHKPTKCRRKSRLRFHRRQLSPPKHPLTPLSLPYSPLAKSLQEPVSNSKRFRTCQSVNLDFLLELTNKGKNGWRRAKKMIKNG